MVHAQRANKRTRRYVLSVQQGRAFLSIDRTFLPVEGAFLSAKRAVLPVRRAFLALELVLFPFERASFLKVKGAFPSKPQATP
jgi:hypothetical protein